MKFIWLIRPAYSEFEREAILSKLDPEDKSLVFKIGPKNETRQRLDPFRLLSNVGSSSPIHRICHINDIIRVILSEMNIFIAE